MNVVTGERGQAVSFLRIHKSDFWYSVSYGTAFLLVSTARINGFSLTKVKPFVDLEDLLRQSKDFLSLQILFNITAPSSFAYNLIKDMHKRIYDIHKYVFLYQ
jgi:hypothetical protein